MSVFIEFNVCGFSLVSVWISIQYCNAELNLVALQTYLQVSAIKYRCCKINFKIT